MQDSRSRKSIRLSSDAYQHGNAFSITIATFERHPWFGLYAELTGMVPQLLLEIAKERETVLFAWCVMPDHLHLLLQDKDIIGFVRVLKGRLTPEGRRLRLGRVLWQRSFFDHALRKEESLNDVARYIWANPVRAGIVDCASEYEWSGSLVWPNWKELLDGSKGGDEPRPYMPRRDG